MNFSRNNRWVICDICGFKFHSKDTVKVTDKYNRHYGLVVCKNDVDKTNAQDRPFTFRETIVTSTDKIRPRQEATYLLNEYDDRLPGAPTNGQAMVDPIANYINLYWDAPLDNGSSAIIGYTVKRATPQLSTHTTIVAQTDSSAAYYQDVTGDVSTFYSYQVAAINTFGTGDYSVPFYWPKLNVLWEDINYLTVSQDGTVLTTSSGIPIRVNHTEVGVV